VYLLQVIDWQKIIEKHGHSVWQAAYRLLGNYSDTCDCFQETFISALKISRRQQVKNFQGLLIRIATARAIDQLRRRFRQETNNSNNDYSPETSNISVDPAKYAQQQELASWLQKSLALLPELESQVFCLRYLNDMSYRQIASELDINKNAVGVLLHRAREKLKNSFAGSPDKQKSEVIL
jgi:RNA polymerase sigma-70 factor, ECF subfamily